MRRRTRHHLVRAGRYLLLWILLPGALLLGVRLVWGMESAFRLASERAALNASGYATRPADYLPPPAPAEQDAIAALEDAWKAYKFSDDDRNLIQGGNASVPFLDIVWTPEQYAKIDAIIADHPDILANMEVAAGRSSFNWPAGFPFDAAQGALSLSSSRELVNYAALATLRSHAHGRDAQALHALHLAFAMARIADEYPDLISHLIAIACHNVACNAYEKIEADLAWNDPEVVAAARVLLDDMRIQQRLHQYFIRAWKADPVTSENETFKVIPSLRNWWIAPLFNDYLRRELQEVARELPALHAQTWPAAKSLYLPDAKHSDLHINDMTFLDSLGGLSDRIILLQMRCIATTNATAILLAARLQFQQTGQFPASLESLKPELRDSLIDPFAADGSPLHYRVDAGGPTVWCVGESGVDDGGTFSPGTTRTSHWHSTAHNEIFGAAWRTAAPPPAISGTALPPP